MIARRKSPRSSALSNQGRWGFAAPGMALLGAVRFGKAGTACTGEVSHGPFRQGKAGEDRHG